ncbi:Co2+/Mg2+ efflux protein ApaG [Gallaecimonas sp. GXIMD4217]|uniref:Co2+/Mg2+ efflux protein ApaG n=1 Tax=Gallaecimonas sp. GXIMD4217 TaxID=3131927 RepID=UPI00311AD701
MSQKLHIQVVTHYLDDRSIPEEDKYVFAYTVTIRNLGTESATLRNRHWLITDGNGKTTEVNGAGVVGKEPSIAAGAEFSYTSGAVLESPVGTMEGYYEMEDEAGERFRTPIPIFRLAVPNVVN